MTVIVESKRLKITNALRDFIDKQAEKLTKLGKNVTEVRVYLENDTKKSSDPQAHSATFKVAIPGKDVVVTKKASDMYVAISGAAGSAFRQLRKRYEKIRGSHRTKS